MKLKQLFRYCLLPQLVVALSLCATSAYAEVVVIVSARSSISHLTAAQATNIFLGKTATFPNGSTAIPFDHPEGSPIRDEFYARIANKSPSQMSAYWTRIIFTGNGNPPAQLAGNALIKKTIAENPNAIGYIDRNQVDNSVRVILAP